MLRVVKALEGVCEEAQERWMPGRRRGRLAGSRAGGRSLPWTSKGSATGCFAGKDLSLDKQASPGLTVVKA